ncbi:GNAT family N-acetyltransferase [Heyndrickxia oleronia]|jgi:RimJ/RimL family protein N-acetyltransferase|uniref:GNAT family N-acetyltransferase n=1 Tax=Heyndrickxia oleronia TaxID=38875 RepID=UPI000903728A|nr:GNAT family N-acetyltransferase [Heyndrickxia oleronia]OJH19724.1 hypothetical protein BLX88_06350 [Bacillus obstructivus]MCI1589395.1 GNAT family N-acetyltransferase [Heyndrickxia oleronia]MCI1612625.1 GNAT family N-acetyltransferase [Heyndrickxia oleronia]MCI1743853.1 GNAT family N-acetyltransferase [Heyndrickxia oleronia]MCI1760606.1 GNAT family N-acetyltransferase [Heyndrickxia oleronia]
MNQFALEGKNVSLRKPSFEDLEYVTWLWADEETMKTIGGPVQFTDEEKRRWYEVVVNPSNGKHFYCLIFNKANKPVGEISFHDFDKIAKTATLNIKIAFGERRKGYASEAAKLMLDYYFNVWNGEIMRYSTNKDNIEGHDALLRFGFGKVYETDKEFLVAFMKDTFNLKYNRKAK